jgi:Domain of unknown function (DUF4145)
VFIKVINLGQGNAGDISGTCPHCEREVTFRAMLGGQIADVNTSEYWTGQRYCPNATCNGHVFIVAKNHDLIKIYPSVPPPKPRPEPHESVKPPYNTDYNEAAAVLSLSAKASAALSRRILQTLIRDKAGIQKANLSLEIDELIATGGLPSRINESVDAIRNIGNFAAHPIKSTNTGEIVEVEPGEAEWNLDVLDMMFDHYFVQPFLLQEKKDALNKKLVDAGKPPMK